MAIVTNPCVVEDFTRRVVEEDLRVSIPCRKAHGFLATAMTGMRLDALDRLSRLWRWALPTGPVPAV
jgi:hypothetical protein